MAHEHLEHGSARTGQWVLIRLRPTPASPREWVIGRILRIRQTKRGTNVVICNTPYGPITRPETHCVLAPDSPPEPSRVSAPAVLEPGHNPIGPGTGRLTGWTEEDDRAERREKRRREAETFPRFPEHSLQAGPGGPIIQSTTITARKAALTNHLRVW